MRIARGAAILAGLLLASAAALTFVPVPSRTLSYTDSDFVLLFGSRSGCRQACRMTAPINASAGDVVATDFHYYLVFNDTVVGTWNGTAWIASLGYARQYGCGTDLATVAGSNEIPSDGPYVVTASATQLAPVGDSEVNATVILDGTVTITHPGAYVTPEVILAASGGLFLVAAVIAAVRSRPRRTDEPDERDAGKTPPERL